MIGGMFGPPPSPGASFLNLFGGDSQLSLQEIADKAHQLQQKIDQNAEQEKASLRAAAEQKHQEIERHAAELSRHAASSIEAHKTAQIQGAERQKAYQQAIVRQQAEQAKRLIDQQAAQAIAAVETRGRQMDLQRQQQEMGQRAQPSTFLGGPASVPCGGAVAATSSPYRCGGAGAPSSPQLSGLPSYSQMQTLPANGHSWVGDGLARLPSAAGGALTALPPGVPGSPMQTLPAYPGLADASKLPAHTVYTSAPPTADAAQIPMQTVYSNTPPTLPPRVGTMGNFSG